MTNQWTVLVRMCFKFELHILFFRSKPDIKMEPSSGRPVDYQVWRQTKEHREEGELNNIPTLQKTITPGLELPTRHVKPVAFILECIMLKALNIQSRPQINNICLELQWFSLWCLLTNYPLHGCCVEQLNCTFVSVLALYNSFKCRKSIYPMCAV